MKGATSRQLLREAVPQASSDIGLWIGALLLLSGGGLRRGSAERLPTAQSALQSVVDTMVEATGLLASLFRT